MARNKSSKRPDVIRLWQSGERITAIADELRMCVGTVSSILQEEGLHTPKPTKHSGVNKNALADNDRYPPSSWSSEIILVGFDDPPAWAMPYFSRVKMEARP